MFNDGSLYCIFWGRLLEEWEYNHLLDPLTLAQQHYQAIETDSPTCAGHETVFKSLDKVSVSWGVLLLDCGIVELSVAVNELPSPDK